MDLYPPRDGANKRRAPHRTELLLALAATLFTLAGIEVALEVYQARAEARRDASPTPWYTTRTYTTNGVLVSSERGPLALVLDPLLVYRNRPKQVGPWFTINSRGYRGRELAAPRTGRRVVLIGGSAAFGTGVSSDRDTLAAHLETGLGGAEVVNAAVIGYVSTQELALLRAELLDLEPDMVVAYDGWNDLQSWRVVREGVLLSTPFVGVEKQCWTATQTDTRFLFALRKMLARVFPEIQRRVGDLSVRLAGAAQNEFSEPWIAARVESYVRNVEAMARACAARGVRFVAVLQPDAEGIAGYVRFRELASVRLRGAGVEVIDGATLVGLRPEHYLDGVHLTGEGNRLVAGALASRLDALMRASGGGG